MTKDPVIEALERLTVDGHNSERTFSERLSDYNLVLNCISNAPKWQEIKTAPKDGTKFIAYSASRGAVCDVCWSEKRNDFDIDGFSCAARDYTHWMPINPPEK